MSPSDTLTQACRPVLFYFVSAVGVKYSSKSPVMPTAMSNFLRFFVSYAVFYFLPQPRARKTDPGFYCPLIRVHQRFLSSFYPRRSIRTLFLLYPEQKIRSTRGKKKPRTDRDFAFTTIKPSSRTAGDAKYTTPESSRKCLRELPLANT